MEEKILEEENQLVRHERIIFPSYWQRFVRRIEIGYEKIICILFKKHNWSLQIYSWNLTKISTIEEYRYKKANKLKCIYCNKIENTIDANLNPIEQYWYNWETFISYDKYVKKNNNI